MQIFKKTHEKKLEIATPISFSIDEIIDSLEPGLTFVINDLFLYTISSDFKKINFHLIINRACKAYLSFDTVELSIVEEKYLMPTYIALIKNNFDENFKELTELKNLITV